MLAYLPVCFIDGRWYSQLFDVGCDRCYCHCVSCKPLRCYVGRCFLLMMLPLWQMEWPHFLLLSLWQMEKPHYEITDDVVTVADGKATV